MINRSQLKFHETFQPELSYIAKLLSLASERFAGNKFAISEITGIPTGKQKGKVGPHIKYAAYMGLIDYKNDKGVYTLELTQMGNEVFMQDPFLHENLTKWLCHYGISRKETGAPQWSYIVHMGHSGFYQSNTSVYHLEKANSYFATSISFEEMFGVVKRSYLEGCFSSLNYLEWDDEVRYLAHSENPELLFAYAYAILKSWDALYPGKQEITIDELNNGIGFDKIFNLSEEEIDSILDELAFKGIVSVNRQLYPPTIIRTADTSEAISKLYIRLL